MRKIISMIVMLSLAFSLAACQLPTNTNTPTNPEPAVKAGEAVAFVTLDINPSIEITLDENGIVASVYGANEDGQVLLYGEAEGLIGLNYEDAVAYITDLAADLGYLDTETGTINTSVTADDLAFAQEVQAKLGQKIQAAATANGITVAIDTSDPFSLLCELEALKAEYPNRVDIQEISLTEYKLAVKLSEREDISVVAALEYDSSEMIKRISSAHATLETYATEAYLAAKQEAVSIFNKSMAIAVAGAYNDVYLKNLMSHIGTFYYGAAYQAYATTAITYRSIYEIKTFGDSMANFELGAASLDAIKTTLNLTDTTALENEEGKITVDSLIAFCDRFVAENEVSDDVKAEISRIVSDAKAAAELVQQSTTVAYPADMQTLKTQIGTVITTIQNAYNTAKLVMTSAQKEEIEACLADLAQVEAKVGEIMNSSIALSEVDALASEAEVKAEEMLVKIKADLSADELASAEKRIEELKALQASLTSDFEARLTAAETQAKKHIEDARKARENANTGK